MMISLEPWHISEEGRQAINSYYGKPGAATRYQVRKWIMSTLENEIDRLIYAMSDPEDE
jgi:hypothetical protein